MKKDVGFIAGVVSFVILIASVLFFVIQLWRLDMLPAKIFIPVVMLAVLITALISIYLLQKIGKYLKKKPVSRYVAIAAALICSVGSLLGGLVITKAISTMSAVTDQPQISSIVDVRTLAEDSAKELDDVRGYTFGITDAYDMENTWHVLREMEKLWGAKPEVKEYPSVMAMFDGLYQKEIDALILNNAYMGILEHMDAYHDAGAKTKVIHEFPLVAEPALEETQGMTGPVPEETEEKETGITEMPFLLYLSGSDSRSSKITERSNTDVNIIAAVNPVTKEILLVNTPRDYYIPNPAGNGALDKLTHCGTYGIDCSMEALGDLYETYIDYYARINFAGFETLIDALGGITVESDASFSRGYTTIRKGQNTLNGRDALVFARERYLVPGGDIDRGKNQMKVIQAVIDKLTSTSLLKNYSDIMDSMQGMFLTDMPADTISQLVKMQLSDMAKWKIHSYAMEGSGNSKVTYSIPGMEVYVMEPDQAMVAHAQDLIDWIEEGRSLTDADMVTPGKE